MHEELVPATVHGAFLLRHAEPPGPVGLLVGFHGYAENARMHMADLEAIPGASGWTIAAVEALHPFYRGRTQEVVGSWMTARHRETAIEDTLAYVDRVLDRIAAVSVACDRLVFA